jgi:lactaldehyde reductase
MDIEKFVLNETSYFGEGARKVLPEEIKKRGFKKVLVVTDASLYDAGVTTKVTDLLDANNIKYAVYHDVKPNPPVENVLAGVDMCKKEKADLLVAVGGGSSIDTAKGISIVITNPDRDDVVSLNGLSNTKNKGLPIIALPTTAGTAAEVTINYVITDTVKEIKMVCVDEHDIPIMAIVDTELMASMPKSIASSTGMDALTHAIEGYITKAKNIMSQMFSMKAIQLIYDNLAKAVNEKNQDAINKVGLGQYIAGMGFSNVGLGIVHSMAHQLGAVYDTPHGLANAILLPTVMEFNGEVSYEDFREILIQAFHIDATLFTKEEVIKSFCECIKNLSYEVGITQTIKDVGAKKEDFPMLADKAMIDPCKPGNPRDVTKEEFIELYTKAW